MKVLLFGSPTTSSLKGVGIDSYFPGAGWVETLIDCLTDIENIEIGFCFFYGVKKPIFKDNGKIKYFCLPDYNFDSPKVPKKTKKIISNALNSFDYDLVHVIGSERPHCKFILEQVGADKFVVSFTGLIYIISELYFAGVDKREFQIKTIGDFLLNRGVIRQQINYKRKSLNELFVLKNGKYFIGRTEFDYSALFVNNKKAKYFFLNECLRKEFYENANSWNIEEIEKHRIFFTQGNYPLKGVHILIKSISYIKDIYPDIKLVVAGPNILKKKGLLNTLRFTTYGKYIHKLIKKYNLTSNVEYIGNLTATEMVEQYKKANVAVVSSIIENKSNTLGEAMIIGTPVISSFSGGMTEMIEHGVSGFVYPFNEPERLALYLSEIFKNNETAISFSKNEPFVAHRLFNYDKMKNDVYQIYKEIIINEKK